MEDLFDRILDRPRSWLDIPALRTIFGLKARPYRTRKDGPPAQESCAAAAAWSTSARSSPG